MTTRPPGSPAAEALLDSAIAGLAPARRGKVRDVYELDGERLIIVATDRISAYDVVLPNGVPDKGRVLTQISEHWFARLRSLVPNHLLDTALDTMPSAFSSHPEIFEGRSMLVRKTRPFPIECVVRGYLAGSAWKEYKQSGTVAGEALGRGLNEGDRLDPPIFTPATKAETGHDENISFARMREIVGGAHADALRAHSLAIFRAAAEHVARAGLVLVDTKFEFGLDGGEILLIDEALTPDSSRFWEIGSARRVSFDKQFVRDWLDASGWDHSPPAPALPPEIVERTRALYVDAYRRITGEELRVAR
jgi:phosphoribosylaminoimidazole-succinocarboxamide synthase